MRFRGMNSLQRGAQCQRRNKLSELGGLKEGSVTAWQWLRSAGHEMRSQRMKIRKLGFYGLLLIIFIVDTARYLPCNYLSLFLLFLPEQQFCLGLHAIQLKTLIPQNSCGQGWSHYMVLVNSVYPEFRQEELPFRQKNGKFIFFFIFFPSFLLGMLMQCPCPSRNHLTENHK